MTKLIRKISIALLVFAVIAAAFATLPLADGVAFATQSSSYDSSGFWYYGSDALNISGAKNVVKGWNKSKLSPVIIAVADTGIDASHELFDGVLYTKNGEAVGYNSRTGMEMKASALPDNALNDSKKIDKHGNSVAGVIAMLIKEFGLEDYIKIYPIKANNLSADGRSEIASFTIPSTINALNKAREIGADVINLSLGILESDIKATSNWAGDRDLLYAIDLARESMLVVAAAGNDENGGHDSARAGEKFYPAALSGVYSVMNYGKNGSLHPHSNYGGAYDIAAPGEDIWTAFDATVSSTKYQTKSGTSIATPFASFTAALLKLRFQAENKAEPSGNDLLRMMKNLSSRTTVKGSYTIKCLDIYKALTQDFENTAYHYSAPESIELSHNGKLGTGDYQHTIVMQATTVEKITFLAKINPIGETSPDLDDSIEWLLRRTVNGKKTDTSIGTGAKLEYFAEVYGASKIIARLRYGNKTIEAEQAIYIEYAPYLVGDVRVTYAENMNDSVSNAPSSGMLYTGETAAFSLTGLKYVDQTVPIKWFVNGEYVCDALVFEFAPQKAGNYVITAQYGDQPALDTTYVFTATVKPFIVRPLDLAMLILGLVIIVAAGVLTTILVIKHKKGKVSVGNSEAQKEEISE